MRVRSRIAVLTTALLTCLAALPANPAAADDKDAALAKLPPSPVVDQVAGAIGELALKNYTGSYAGLRVDAATSTVTVYSTDAAAAKKLTDSALLSVPAQTRASVKVQAVPAAYSKAELWKARATLWAKKETLQASGAKVIGIAARPEGEGLTVLLNKKTSVIRTTAAASVATVAEAAAGVPVDVDWRAAPAPISRFDDSPPYWGGSYVKKTQLGWTYECTSAFGMAISGREWLMTADHCFDLNDTIKDGGDDVIGVANRRNIYNDALGIETNTNRTVWVADQLYARYSGAAWSFTGQYVCHGGFVTSVIEPICGINVTIDDLEWEIDNDGLIRRGVEGFRCSGCVAGAKGDSGGPVLASRADGSVESRGILSAAAEEVDYGYEYVYWTETPRILSAFGGTLITTD
ncbi:hypothetical protein [Actinoplanes solisilvae]|uniref:hypothetical protein n=1 Tax=Actinoplanes solisilvae TaxID=2486853 RepID=UPI000FDA89ED|nr:hypothetical protein [Actinoplanes solisilvae]